MKDLTKGSISALASNVCRNIVLNAVKDEELVIDLIKCNFSYTQKQYNFFIKNYR